MRFHPFPTLVSAALALAIGACTGKPSSAAPPSPAPLVSTGAIKLSGSGRIDHMALDEKAHRLFVAELGSGALESVDVETGRSLARRIGLREPQGVAYVPALDQVVVACGGDGMVRFLSAPDLSEVGTVPLGDDADDVRIDATGRVVVGFGDGALAVIDPATRRVVGEVKLGAHPEGFSLDPESGRAYVNLPARRAIAVADLVSGRVAATWSVGARAANYPMALDAADGRLFVGLRLPARLVAFDTASGAERVAVETCGDADDIYFDSRRRRVYVSCGAGRVEVFSADLQPLGRIATGAGARTSLFSQARDRLWVARPARAEGAALLAYRPTP